jgi:predicted short-subunit dehydrogenase-like oxidoreductase (DUF2520 family)
LASTRIKSLHPLASFGEDLFPLEFYKTIPFVTEMENPFDLRARLPSLPNPVVKIPRAGKARYHALCVAANNFSTILWQKYFQGLQEEFGIPPKLSLSLLDSTDRNLRSNWRAALTGPLARGDQETVMRNLRSLEGHDLREIYEDFVKIYRKDDTVRRTPADLSEMGL